MGFEHLARPFGSWRARDLGVDTTTPRFDSAPHAERCQSVLVIDDEPSVRMVIAEVLREFGYEAIEAIDGPSGLAILLSGARIDLLLSDVALPNGMNGRQVAEAARQVLPGLKVLFITGYAEHAAVIDAYRDDIPGNGKHFPNGRSGVSNSNSACR
jgi:CheY-like chemotaxis protein